MAPKDTLKSLHFAEVAHYFNTLTIPRGAYAARAMGERRWNSLSDEQRQILKEGVAVWERALEQQLHAAEIAGDTVGRENGVVYTSPSPEDVAQFLAGYELYAGRSAAALSRFDLDGMPTYQYARKLVDYNARHGKIDCNGDAE